MITVVLREKFITVQAYIKNKQTKKQQEKSQINNPTLQLNVLKKDQQTKPKAIRRKKIIKTKKK